MATAGGKFTAHDGAAETQDDVGDRPMTDAERAYLDQRVEDTAEAVKTIKRKIKGMERTLAEAEREHEAAKAARDGSAE